MGIKNRSQTVCFQLANDPSLTNWEVRLVHIINSLPHFYLMKETLQGLSQRLKCSRRTIQRAIKSLLEKGLITRRYAHGKKLLLRMVSLKLQQEYCKGNKLLGLTQQIFEHRKAKKQGQTVHEMSHPIKECILNPIKQLISVTSCQNRNIEILENKRNAALLKASLSPIYENSQLLGQIISGLKRVQN